MSIVVQWYLFNLKFLIQRIGCWGGLIASLADITVLWLSQQWEIDVIYLEIKWHSRPWFKTCHHLAVYIPHQRIVLSRSIPHTRKTNWRGYLEQWDRYTIRWSIPTFISLFLHFIEVWQRNQLRQIANTLPPQSFIANPLYIRCVALQ